MNKKVELFEPFQSQLWYAIGEHFCGTVSTKAFENTLLKN